MNCDLKCKSNKLFPEAEFSQRVFIIVPEKQTRIAIKQKEPTRISKAAVISVFLERMIAICQVFQI